MTNPFNESSFSPSSSPPPPGMCRLWGLWEMDNGKWASQESEIALRTGNNIYRPSIRYIYLHTYC